MWLENRFAIICKQWVSHRRRQIAVSHEFTLRRLREHGNHRIERKRKTKLLSWSNIKTKNPLSSIVQVTSKNFARINHLISQLGFLLLVFLADLLEQDLLQILECLVSLLHLRQHRCLHIWQPNGDGLHLSASRRSNRCNFSAIASLQNAEIFRQWLFFSGSSAWWSFWASPSG